MIADWRVTKAECIASVVGDCMADTKTLIEQAYFAFNKRDIDGALALMTQDVSWPEGFGGRQTCRKGRDPRLLDSTMGRVRSTCRTASNHRGDGGKVRVRVHHCFPDKGDG